MTPGYALIFCFPKPVDKGVKNRWGSPVDTIPSTYKVREVKQLCTVQFKLHPALQFTLYPTVQFKVYHAVQFELCPNVQFKLYPAVLPKFYPAVQFKL